MSSGSFWRCVPCGADVQFGTAHTCTIAPTYSQESKPSRAPRSPFPAVDYAPHEIGKE